MNSLKRLSAWCYSVMSPALIVVALIVMIVFMVFVLPKMAGQLTEMTGVSVSPDTSFIYSADDLYQIAYLYGAEGRAYYIYQRFTFDLLWPAVYLLFLVTVLTGLFNHYAPDSRLRLVNLFPFIGALFDLLENSAASLVMYRYPLPSPLLAHITPIFTFLKWVFIGASFVALAAGLLLKFYAAAVSNAKNKP